MTNEERFARLTDLDLEQIGKLAGAAAEQWDEHHGTARWLINLVAQVQAELCRRHVGTRSFTRHDWTRLREFTHLRRQDQDVPEQVRDFWTDLLSEVEDERQRPAKEIRQLEDDFFGEAELIPEDDEPKD